MDERERAVTEGIDPDTLLSSAGANGLIGALESEPVLGLVDTAFD